MPPQTPPQEPIPTNQVPQPMPMEHDGAPTVEKLKRTLLMFIGASVAAGFLLITTMVFAAGASTTDAKLKEQYNQGLEAGKAEQKQSDTIAFNKEITGSTRTYEAPVKYGSFQITYPKSWNLVVDSTSPIPVGGKIGPGYVNWVSPTQPITFSLIDTPYETMAQRYEQNLKSNKGTITGTDTTVSGIKGRQYTGKINEKDKTAVGTVVIVPLRDKTMLIQTDDNKLYGDTYRQTLATAKLIP